MTKRNRFYLLIAMLALHTTPEKSYADYYTTEQVNLDPGVYYESEGGNLPVCAGQAGTVSLPAYLCVPSKDWGNRDAIKQYEEDCNAAETFPSSFYQANPTTNNRVEYLERFDGSYLICTKDNGWKYVNSLPVPNPCNSSTCSNGNWTNLEASNGATYQSKAERYCATTTLCKESNPQYRCGAGYYGTSDFAGYGCGSCGESSDDAASSPNVSAGYKVEGYSTAGATTKSQCYIPSYGGSAEEGYIDSNGTGTYMFTSNCYWS